MILLLLGAPGSGKGTQAKVLKSAMKVPHLSTGDMLREATKAGSMLGREASSYMQRGALVPDSLVLGLLRERISAPDCATGFILDGFPRNITQADALENTLRDAGRSVDRVIAMDVSEAELVARLSGRRTCRSCGVGYHVAYQPPRVVGKCDQCGGELYQRSDDVESVIKERLGVYLAQTSPLLDYYSRKGLLKKISGSGDPKEISQRLLQAVRN